MVIISAKATTHQMPQPHYKDTKKTPQDCKFQSKSF